MKRVFLILMAVMLLFALALPCVAADSLTVVDDVEDEAIADGEDGGVDVITDFWNWLMSHKDDIMAMILLVAAALYKWGSGAIKKHIIPELEKQGAKVADMASAAGKITLTNKNNFEQVMNEVKEVIKEVLDMLFNDSIDVKTFKNEVQKMKDAESNDIDEYDSVEK